MQITRTVRFLIVALQIFIGFENNSIVCHTGPHSENHDHYVQGPGEEFQMDKLMHDRHHLMEDLSDMYGMGFGEYFLSKEEMEFLFFKSHDLDKNDKLDGLEMLYAIGHVEQDTQPNNLSMEALNLAETNVDDILAKYDVDNDGYLNYDEFATGNRN